MGPGSQLSVSKLQHAPGRRGPPHAVPQRRMNGAPSQICSRTRRLDVEARNVLYLSATGHPLPRGSWQIKSIVCNESAGPVPRARPDRMAEFYGRSDLISVPEHPKPVPSSPPPTTQCRDLAYRLRQPAACSDPLSVDLPLHYQASSNKGHKGTCQAGGDGERGQPSTTNRQGGHGGRG